MDIEPTGSVARHPLRLATAVTSLPSSATVRDSVGPALLWAVLLVGLPGLWLACQFMPPLNHDAAAILHFAERWLDGERLYLDLVDVNPPLIFLISTVPVAAARVLGGTPVHWFVGLTAAVVVTSAVAVRALLPAGPGRPLALAALLFVTAAAPAFQFGQREHLMVVLAAPWLFAAMARAEGRADRPAAGAGPLSAVAVVAALAFALKPHFVLAPMAVEALVLLRRGPRPLREDPTALVLAAATIAHWTAVALLVPAYFSAALPLSLTHYAALTAETARWVTLGPYALGAIGAAAAGAALAWLTRSWGVAVLVAFGFGAVAAGVLQGRGWEHHLVPADAAGALVLAVGLASALDGLGRRLGPADAGRLAMVATLAVVGGLYLEQTLWRPPWERGWSHHTSRAGELEQAVRTHATDGRVLVLSTAIEPIFPVVNDTGVRLASRYLTMWVLESAYGACDRWGAEGFRETAQMDPAEAEVFDTVSNDFARLRPRLLIVDEAPGFWRCDDADFDFLAYFRRNAAFAETLRGYAPVGHVGKFALWRRTE